MIFTKPRSIFITLLLSCTLLVNAQEKPIGYWESFLPYNSALGVATDGNVLYTICDQAFFTFNNTTGDIQPYSKVEGMHDIGMQSIGYDFSTATAILGYANGNIDLFKDNTFYNIPDFKIKNIAGVKTINQVYALNGVAYLSTSQGIIVIDLVNHIDSETIQFVSTKNEVIPISSFASAGGYFFTATANGVYTIRQNDPRLRDYQYWQRIDSTDSVTDLATVNNTLYLSNNSKVFTWKNNAISAIYVADSGIQHIDAGNNQLLIAEGSTTGGKVKVMDSASYNFVDSFESSGATVQAVQLLNKSLWVASPITGLSQRVTPNQYYPPPVSNFVPEGPADPNSYDLYANNKNLYIAHGGFDDLMHVLSNPAGVSYLNNGKWTHYQRYAYTPFDTLLDFVALAKDEIAGTLYMGSYQQGLFILDANGSYQLVDQNPPFDGSNSYGPGYHQVVGLTVDQSENLWVTLMFAPDQLYVKTADSNWCKFQVPNISAGGPVITDNNGQVWFASDAGDGVAVYNTNNTPCDKTDDATYHLANGVGLGNLPSNNAKCLAKDLNNNIWIGTDNGIGIVSNCNAPFTGSPPCDAVIPIVQYDQFAGYLFAGYTVTSIAVDGANRKWVGTDDGLWLLSPDASQIVYYFTEDNSPLPSNNIQKIAIDQVTGDVYIGTDEGLVSYRSTATTGGTSTQNVLIYPDPVPSAYTGTIAIKGLAANADVRITDITGQLVYRTTALGGQAVWNGMDYTGHRPQTGIYLILTSSSDGSQTYIGKIAFIQ